jgi:hypothetical protein
MSRARFNATWPVLSRACSTPTPLPNLRLSCSHLRFQHQKGLQTLPDPGRLPHIQQSLTGINHIPITQVDLMNANPILPGRSSVIPRREFLRGGTALFLTATLMRPWQRHQARAAESGKLIDLPDFRQGSRDLVILPVLMFDTPKRQVGRSWRNWTGLQTPESVKTEAARIETELRQLQLLAEFGMRILPLGQVSNKEQVTALQGQQADVVLVYAAGGWTDTFDAVVGLAKQAVVFLRHSSGPYYLWDEIVSSRLLRQHTDHLQHPRLDVSDIVVDDPQELLWRLRAHYGLANTIGQPIVCVGGPGGWATPNAPELARKRFQLDMKTVTIPEIIALIEAGRKDNRLMAQCRQAAQQYLDCPLTTLKTTEEAVIDCFLLQHLFNDLMAQHKAHAVTVQGCMNSYSGIMPCLTLTLVNDSGKMAYCEGDFVVIPSGILMHFISGKPTYFCNPTFPRGNRMMFAHCTAPRMMDGKTLDPAHIVTHYESDHGAATHVDFRLGQQVTVIKPDFEAVHWMTTTGIIKDTPVMDTCTAQIELELDADPKELVRSLRGFHSMLAYGDYTKEIEYAAHKVGIKVQVLKA